MESLKFFPWYEKFIIRAPGCEFACDSFTILVGGLSKVAARDGLFAGIELPFFCVVYEALLEFIALLLS